MPFIRHVGQAQLSECCAPAQEHSLPQDSCMATTAIQEGPLCHLQHLHLPSPSGFQWSTLNQTVSWCNTINHMDNARFVTDGVSCTPHVDCRKLCHTELCQGLLGTGQGTAMASLFLRLQRQLPSCAWHESLLPSSAIIQGVFPWPCVCQPRVQSIRSDRSLYRELVGAFDLLQCCAVAESI